MILKVIIWTASILKVVDPGPIDPLYVIRDPACELFAGEVEVTMVEEMPEDPAGVVGWLTQDGEQCDIFELVYPGV